jgi:Fe-S oxidoreductase
MGMHDEIALLRITGADVQLLDSGCCGMAGPFGFEKEKFDLSQKLGERVLLPAVRNNSKAIIVSDGFSCCEQITQNTNARPKHLAELLAQQDR